EARLRALRRFKYRQLLRIGCRDILGDADLTVTTEELARMADVCLGAAWRWAHARLERLHGVPVAPDGTPTGLAVIGMGKLGGDELNYSSDIDLIFVYGADGSTTGGETGPIANGDFFAAAAKAIVAALESVTEEGHAFRVDLRLRPEGRMGPIALSLEGYGAYVADRAVLWERQALIKARFCAGDPAVAARFFELIGPFVYRPGLDPAIVGEIRRMKGAIDRSLRAGGGLRRNVKLGTAGIREVEFLVPAGRGRLARRMGSALPVPAAGRRFLARHRRITAGVHAAFRDFFAARPATAPLPAARVPSYTALKATGFADPDRARQNLRLV